MTYEDQLLTFSSSHVTYGATPSHQQVNDRSLLWPADGQVNIVTELIYAQFKH
ncbi:MAG: hypothetical protein ACM359_07290 [Bacillota bacterium]